MTVCINKNIYRVDGAEFLGTIQRPGEKPQHILQKNDYCLHAGQKPFLFLGIDKEVKRYCLAWDTSLSLKNFYLPSLLFHQNTQRVVRGTKEGIVKVEEWGDEYSYRTFSLEEYLKADSSVQPFLNNGFTQQQGESLIQTPQYQLLLGRYSRKTRIAVATEKDLSDALGPLVRATSRLHFTEDDDERLTAAITYLLNETIFEETHH